MKKISLIVASLTVGVYTYAQQQKNENKWGCAIAINSIQAQVEIPMMTGAGALIVDADGNILTGGKRADNSFSLSVMPKYYINEEFLFRFELGITNLKLSATYNDKGSNTHTISSTKITDQVFRYAGGLQWIFFKRKRIESYCGSTISFISYRNLNINTYYEHREVMSDTITDWGRNNEVTPGGFAVGVGACAGFNVYFNRHISLGSELSSCALLYKLGGTTRSEGSGQVAPGPILSSTTTFSNSYTGFKISKIISSFNISIWL